MVAWVLYRGYVGPVGHRSVQRRKIGKSKRGQKQNDFAMSEARFDG